MSGPGQIIEVPGALAWLHSAYFDEGLRGSSPAPKPLGDNAPPGPAAPLPDGLPADDAALIEKATRARNGRKLAALYAGDLGGLASPSEADLALCSLLAFWTQDPERIDRIFRGSGLFRAEKWDRPIKKGGPTYGEKTISKALASCRETYQGKRTGPTRNGPPEAPTAAGGAEAAELPLIRLEAGALPRNVTEAGAALVKAGVPVYQRGPAAVRPVVIEAPKIGKAGGLPAGALILVEVSEPWLQKAITGAARIEKFDGRREDWTRTNCPPWLAKGLLADVGAWPFPVLTGILESPTLRPDGTLLDTSGYDPATGLFLHLAPGLKVKVPDKPTLEQARQAAAFLGDPLNGFPFADLPSLSVAVAAILTALVRRLLPTAPGFLFDAPAPGSGKTLLADVVALIATGRRAPIVNQAPSDEETEKRIGVFLIQGHAVMNVDNLFRPLAGELPCSMLTAPEIPIRILGESRSPTVPTNLVFLATGNNATVKGDLSRRILLCRLDPETERPEQRRFALDLYDWIPRNRGKLIAAGLTILKGYQAAGRPDMGLEPFGSFEEWAAWVRGALVWVGHQDPCQTRTRLEGGDHVTGELLAVLTAWHRDFPMSKHTVRGLTEKTEALAYADLRAALLTVAASRAKTSELDTKRLSFWLRKHERRVIGGLRLVREHTVNGDLWSVESLERNR